MMVASKGKSTTALNPVSEDTLTRKNVGRRNFKVYSENERVKVDANRINSASGLPPPRRKSVSVNKGATMTSASNSKGALKNVEILEKSKGVHDHSGKAQLNIEKSKGVHNHSGKAQLNIEKTKGMRENFASIRVGRIALADVSNVQGNISKNAVCDGSKPMKSKSERTSLQRVLLGPSTRTVNVSSRKSLTEKKMENISKGTGDLPTSKRVGIKDLKASSDEQRRKTKGIGRESLITDCRRTARNPIIPTRKSLPVLTQVNQVDTSDRKDNAKCTTKAKEKSGFSVKEKISRKVLPRVSNDRTHLWRNRASDGFIIMGQTDMDARALSRKSIRPNVKTTIAASNAQRTSKSKCRTGQNKMISAAKSSKNNEKEVMSLPENTASVVSCEAIQAELRSDSKIDQSESISDGVARRKSVRRRSYTSLFMARSKLLEEHGEVMKLEKLPSIDDSCNQLEVAEYVDEIYHYYWFTEVHNPSLENYMSIQTEITPHMRGILINWLIEVHFKFDLMQETLYLMVMLLDQYLSQVAIRKNEMQLVGLTALLLASKYEDFWHPRIKDLISISAESYTRDQMLGMEKLMLRKLKFRLNVPTPYVFMLRFLKAAKSDTKLEHLAFYLIELCLIEYEALKSNPSLLCASTVFVARCTLQMTPAWTPQLRKHARYEESQIRDCAEMILRFQKAARTGQLNVTYEKYLRPDLGGVAAIKPMDRLP